MRKAIVSRGRSRSIAVPPRSQNQTPLSNQFHVNSYELDLQVVPNLRINLRIPDATLQEDASE